MDSRDDGRAGAELHHRGQLRPGLPRHCHRPEHPQRDAVSGRRRCAVRCRISSACRRATRWASAPSRPARRSSVGPCSAPSAPTGLAYTTADNLVTLAWTPPASGITQGYWLYAGTAPGCPTRSSPRSDPRRRSSAPPVYGTYYVRLAARNSCAVGPNSAELTVVVAPCTVRPNAPDRSRVHPYGNVVTLSWSAPSSGNLPSRYVILAGIDRRERQTCWPWKRHNPATSFAASAPPAAISCAFCRATTAATASPTNEVEIVVP